MLFFDSSQHLLFPPRARGSRPLAVLPLVVLLLGSLPALAQAPTITALSPTRNLRNAAASANVAVTFSQVMQNTTATQQAVRVFSQQRGGRMFGTQGGTASVSGPTITFNPTTNFKPGETLLVTTTTAAQAGNGTNLLNGRVYQFTAAVGGTGTGIFAAPVTSANPSVGSIPYEVATGDVDGDGDLDFLTANEGTDDVSVRLNQGGAQAGTPGTFAAGSTVSVGDGPRAVTLGDVDGDGDLDLVAANYGLSTGTTLSVRLNQGGAQAGTPGLFGGGSTVSVGLRPVSVALGDVDSDGDLDLVVANLGDDNASIRLNNGAGSFSGTHNVSLASSPQSVTVGDVDSDGDLDLLAVCSGVSTVSVRTNNGIGVFSGSQNVSVGATAFDVAVGDIDADGDLDLLTTDYVAGTASIRLNQGGTQAGTPGTFSGGSTVSVGVDPSRGALGDVDGDGDLDLLTANLGDNTVSVRLNNGSGTFSGTRTVATNGAPSNLALGDVDGDGDLDLLTSNISTNTVSVRLNLGSPTLTSLAPTSGPVGASVTLMGTDLTGATGVRFNGTAATSFTVNSATSITATVPLGATTGNVTVTTPGGTSNGQTFTVMPLVITALSPTRNQRNAAASANVAVTFSQTMQNTAATQGAVRVFSQQRGGRLFGTQGGVASVSGSTITFNPTNNFKPGETVLVTTTPAATATGGATLAQGKVYQFTAAAGGTGLGTFAAPATTPNPSVGSSPQSVAVGDVDGDGDLDFVTANTAATGTASVRLNDGTGSFSSTNDVSVGSHPRSVALGDVDGDGDLDLLTANYANNTMSVRLNNGSGAFSGTTNPSVGTGPQSVALGDVDGDGDLDLLTANFVANTVSVRLNNGSGAFSGGSDPAVGTGPYSVAVGDVDSDGDLDLLCANADANTVSVRLNNGSGAFSGSQDVNVGTGPQSIAVGDLDGDGDLDLIAGNRLANMASANTVSVRLNDGAGTFGGTQEVSANGGPQGVALGDVDGDGDLDLLVALVNSNLVSVRRNNGSGTFNTTTTVSVGSTPWSVAVGDIDGDGDLDLLTANRNLTGSTSVRLNVAAPTLTSLAPTSAPVGASVTLTGTDFTGATAVSFNGTAATSFMVNSAASITVTVPAGLPTGTVTVTVTTPMGTSNGVAFTVSLGITALSPTRNLRNAARTSDVAVTFDRPVQNTAATRQAVKVFSQQRGGRMRDTQGGTASVSGSTLTFNPTTDFRAGETVLVTTTTAATSTSGATLARGHVHQFTAAVSASTGTFVAPATADPSVGANPRNVVVGDVDGDGDLDILTANADANTVSVRLNDGSGIFSSGSDASVGTSPQSVVVGDVDGDGDLDLLTANLGDNTVSVRLNNGSGVFSGGSDASVVINPYGVAVGDVDGDGDLDLLASCVGSTNAVSVRLNNGSGTFSGGSDVLVTDNPQSIAVGDLDGDGDLDLLTSSVGTGQVSVRRNDGSGAFYGGYDFSAGGGYYVPGLAVGDLDGDGDLDLVVSVIGVVSSASLVHTWINDGNATFSQGTAQRVGARPRGVAVGDVDGDGDLDLVATYTNDRVAVRTNDGSGNFSGTATVSVPASVVYSMVLGDVDGDGDLDFLTTNSTTNTVSVRFNAGVPTLTSLTPATGPIGASVTLTGTDFTGATAVRFNGTAATSFTVNSNTSITATVPAGATTGNVTVITPIDTSNGVAFTVVPLTITALSPARNLRNAAASSSVAITFDRAMQNVAATQQAVRVFSQQRGGRMFGSTRGVATVSGSTITFNPTNDFKPGETVLVTTTTAATATGGGTLAAGHVHQFTAATGGTGTGSFTAPTITPNPSVGNQPQSVAVGDVDNDGDLDFVTANNGGSVSVRRNNGSGVFSGTQNVPVGTGPNCVVLGDLDGDGDLDLLTANSSANTVSVRLGNGTGSFSGTTDVSVGDQPQSVALGDLDGDGDLDLLTANAGNNTVSVRLNNGAGAFSGTQNLTGGNVPVSVAVGDVDGDGDLDLLTANRFANTVSVRRNDGTGGFGVPTDLSVGTTPLNVVVGDVDGDGDLDLLTVNGGNNTVSVRRNDGTGGFGSTQTVSVGVSPNRIALGDVDGDGDLDLLAASYSSSSVSVRLNDGTGTFSGGSDPSVGANPVSVTVGDVDGDGDLDLLTANYGAGTVSVRFNNSLPTTLSLSSTSVTENTGPNVVIGTLAATDPNAGDTFTYTLVSGAGSTDNALVNISGSQLRITASPDFETQPSYAIRVRVTDQAGGFFEQAFTVSVTNVNEASTALSLAPQSVTENSPGGTAVGTFSTTDPDAGSTFTYTLVSGTGSTDNGAFSISGNQLVITAAPDYETRPSYAIRVRSTDQAGLFTEQTFTISVTDVAEDLTVSTPQTIPAGTYHDVVITGTGQGILGGNVTITGTLLVQAGGQLDDNCFVISGPGTFVLAAGATLEICSAAGITTSGALGTVQVTGPRTYSRAASYVYDSPTTGSSVSTGNGLPNRVRDLTAATSSATLFLTRPTSVRHVLTLAGAPLNLAGQRLTLLSDADSTALVVNVGAGVVLGAATVQRYLTPGTAPALGYRHLSAPVTNTTVADLTTPGFAPVVNGSYNTAPNPLTVRPYPNVFGFDETRFPASADFLQGYFSPSALTDALVPGRGYTVYMKPLRPDFVGTLGNGDVTLAGLTHTGTLNGATQKSGWHLLGNPFPSPLDWDLVTVPTGMSQSVSVFKSTGGSNGLYLTRAGGTGSLPNGEIAMAQAFFVRVTDPAPVSLTLPQAARVTSYSNPTHFRTAPQSRPLVRLTLHAVGAPVAETDEATIYFQAGATAGIDAAFDGEKPGHNVGVPTLVSLSSAAELAVNGLPETALATSTTVELLLDLPAAGTYALARAQLANLPNQRVELLDRLTGTRYDLATTSTVHFTAAQAATITGRFALLFNPLTTVTGTSPYLTPPAFLSVYPNPARNTVRVSVPAGTPSVELLDATGRVVRHCVATGETSLSLTGLPAGVYLVRAGTLTERLLVE